MIKIVEMQTPDDCLIASGKSISLLDIIYHVFDHLNIDRDRVVFNKAFFRPSEILDIYYGDSTKAKNILGWDYTMDFTTVIEEILKEYHTNFCNA